MEEKQVDYYRAAKCPKCGRFMAKSKCATRVYWLCHNPDCEDGAYNLSRGESE